MLFKVTFYLLFGKLSKIVNYLLDDPFMQN
jgi:hypothetical protein